MLHQGESPALDIVDRAGIQELLKQPLGSFNSQLSRNPFETTLMLDQWLQ
nr:hypothetical protein [Saccharopolyspora sp. HNM0986]